jgi:hypothetical protein
MRDSLIHCDTLGAWISDRFHVQEPPQLYLQGTGQAGGALCTRLDALNASVHFGPRAGQDAARLIY